MKNTLYKLIVLISSLLFLNACSTEKEPAFTIIGTWGMVSGTISEGDGTTNRYDEMPSGKYYEILEYKTDGTLIRTSSVKEYGVYTFNNITNELSYKFDGEKYYRPATIQVIDYDEMIVTTDYRFNIGRITQYFVRID